MPNGKTIKRALTQSVSAVDRFVRILKKAQEDQQDAIMEATKKIEKKQLYDIHKKIDSL